MKISNLMIDNSTMTGFERLQKALNFKEADKVPFDLCGTTVSAISKKAYIQAMKYKGLSSSYDPQLIDPIQQIVIPDQLMMEYLGVDTYRIGARRIMNFEKKVQEDEEKYSILDHYQCSWEMKKENGLYFDQITYPLYDFDTLAEAINDFSIYNINLYRHQLAIDIDHQLKNVDDKAIVLDRNCAGLTEMSLRLRGYDKWFMDTILDPDGVESLLDMLIDHKIAYWDLLFGVIEERKILDKVLVVSEADDLGSQTSLLLPPENIRSIVLPRLKKLFGFIKKKVPNAKIFFHTDGAIKELIPDLLDIGMDILNPVQYSASGMDLAELKRQFGKDLIFWGGGIDTQEILNKGTEQQVKDEVRRNIDILAPGGGFVFATVHNIQADVPPANFWAMWETLKEYGIYK